MAAGHDGDVEGWYRTAERHLEAAGLRYQLAVVRGELAEWMSSHGRDDEATALAGPAFAAFEDMRVEPWTRRLEPIRQPVPTPATA